MLVCLCSAPLCHRTHRAQICKCTAKMINKINTIILDFMLIGCHTLGNLATIVSLFLAERIVLSNVYL